MIIVGFGGDTNGEHQGFIYSALGREFLCAGNLVSVRWENFPKAMGLGISPILWEKNSGANHFLIPL